MNTDMAPAVMARDQPKSSISATRKTE